MRKGENAGPLIDEAAKALGMSAEDMRPLAARDAEAAGVSLEEAALSWRDQARSVVDDAGRAADTPPGRYACNQLSHHPRQS